MLRTHTCNELSIKNIGEKVTLTGWISTIRDHGGVLFVDLRDHYGVTQIVFSDDNMLEGLSKETVVLVEGVVTKRDEETVNPKIDTGLIEVRTEKIEVLGPCQLGLPFEIDASMSTREDVRLKYRYLDLRNTKIHKNIVLRSKILSYLRSQMEDMGFLEIQTPILTASSPEGARDYIVPTINAPGEFYALPQAPQQFKQLLMVSGYDKYFQIAPCFRNEAARADRTPGEFYQIDFEMSFATQEDVFEVAENLSYGIYSTFTDYEVCPKPYVRLPYREAINKYCSDKPDLRNPLIVHDVTNIFAGTEFGAFQGKTIKAIATKCEQPRRFYDDLGKLIVSYEGKGCAWVKYTEEGFTGGIAKFVTEQVGKDLINEFNLTVGDSIFFIADEESMAIKLTNVLRNELGEKLNLIDKNKVIFCWIVDFPFYELNEETNAVDFGHNPFSMPQGGMDALLNKNPLDIYAYQYDLVCNGYEMLSGAVRNYDQDVMVKAFEIAGYDREVVENKFPALFNAFSYGAPPHAGGAFGFDRMLMPILNKEVIRDVIAFPLNKSGRDALMGAPSKVNEKQLKDVGIKLIEE